MLHLHCCHVSHHAEGESFPLRLLKWSVRLPLSCITRLMTMSYILHKTLYSLNKKQIIKYLLCKIPVLHHSLETAQQTSYEKLASASMYHCPPDVFGWVKTFSFLLQSLLLFFLFFKRNLIIGLLHKCFTVDYGINDSNIASLQHHCLLVKALSYTLMHTHTHLRFPVK